MKLHDINLNRLRSFYIVHRERGVRKAAKRLHLTPGAVSYTHLTLPTIYSV